MLPESDESVASLMGVSSASLLATARQLRATGVPSAILRNGVTVSPQQLEAAARIIVDSDPSQITSATGGASGWVSFAPQERPGFISRDRQDTPDVLVLDVGILGTTHRINRDGTVACDA